MSDRKGDKFKQPVECQPEKFSNNPCPNLKESGGMEGERYSCDVCGEYFYLDYDDMR